MQKIKRFLSLLLAVVMVIGMVPMNVFAAEENPEGNVESSAIMLAEDEAVPTEATESPSEENEESSEVTEAPSEEEAVVAEGSVAKVGDTEYATIDEAIANWTNGTTLTLLADFAPTEAITIDKNVTLDLNGKTLTLPVLPNYAIVIKDTLTIIDGSDEKTGKVINGDFGIGLATACTGGLYIMSGNFESKGEYSYLIGAYAGKVVISGGNFDVAYSAVNSFEGYNASVSITGGNFVNSSEWAAYFTAMGDNVAISGGTFNVEPDAALIAEGYQYVDGKVQEKALSGKGTESEPYLINNVKDLFFFAELVNKGNTFAGEYVKLTDDIDLAGEVWTPIGTSNYDKAPTTDGVKMFAGNFDGGDHTISGLSSNGYVPDAAETGSTEYSFGLFGYVYGANISNVKLANVDIDCGTRQDSAGNNVYGSGVAALIGYYVPANGKTAVISDCHVLSGTVKASNNMGGLIGHMDSQMSQPKVDITIRNCSNAAAVTAEAREAGGILGLLNGSREGNYLVVMSGSIKFVNCVNTGAVTTEAGGGSTCAGGILGRDNAAFTGQRLKVIFQNCSNSGTITACANGETHVAGLGTAFYSHGSWIVVENSENTGAIVVVNANNETYAGGLVAYAGVVDLINSTTTGDYGYVGDVNHILFLEKMDSYNDSITGATYHLNGGTSPEYAALVDDADMGGNFHLVETAYKEGAEFAGWYTNPELTGSACTALVSGEKHYYAKWKYTTIEIRTWEDLKELDALVESGEMLEGVTVKLMNDIDLYQMGADGEPVSFNPIGANTAYFKGTFDGQGHTIKNMYQSGWALGYDWDHYGTIGLFAYLWNATVKNLTIENAKCFVEGGNVAAIAGCAWGNCTFENITVKNSTFATYNNRAGGIVGYTGGTGTMTFKNIVVDEDTVIAGLWGSFDSSLGGIMGQLQSATEVSFENVNVSCRLDAYNDVTASYQYYAYRMCGMLIGRIPVDGNNQPILDNVTIGENVKIDYSNTPDYAYVYTGSGSKSGWNRVEAGYEYGGVDLSQYPDAEVIYKPFNSMFGGQQYGSYGQDDHEDIVAEGRVAYFDGDYFTSLETVVKAADGAKDNEDNAIPVELMADCDQDIVITDSLLLDLNGYEFSGSVITNKAGYKVVQDENGNYIVAEKDLEGSGTENDPFVINTADDLIKFRNSVNAGETKYNASGVYVALGADIDLGGATWKVNAVNFKGIFDGNDKTISNFHIDATAGRGAFFYKVYGATVKDLTLSDITASVGKNQRVAALTVGYELSTINNVKVKNFEVTTTGATSWIAGLACSGTVNSEVTMNDCTVENFTVNDAYGAQFIAGITAVMQRNGTEADGTNVLNNLHVNNFKVNVNGIVANGSSTAVGGLIGQTQSVWQNPHFKNCSVTGLDVTATGRVDVGGFMAHPGSYTYATNCTVAGKIDVTGVTSSENYAGGFFGDYGWGDNVGKGDHKVTNCTVDVDIITNVATAGGFIGSGINTENKNKNITLTNCVANGTVSCVEGGTATIGGFVGYTDRGAYENCTAAQEPFIGKVKEDSTLDNTSSYVAIVNGTYYADFAAAMAAAEAGDTITLVADIALSETITNTKKVTLDLNGKTITGTDNATGSFSLITNKGELTIKDSVGNGKITLTATNNRGWNAYSSVISNTVGGKLIVENGTIEHLGGSDMAYGIDNLTNGKGTYAETVINGGTVKSTYRAIRQFLNGVEAQNILKINGGTIEGTNKSIWMQDPSKNANTGKLTVGENAVINGDIYLFVTAGSTKWPVEVSIAASAVNGEVISGNVPTGYEVVNVDGTYGVYSGVAKIGNNYYDTLADAVAAANAAGTATIQLVNDVTLGEKLTISGNVTISGAYTITRADNYTGTLFTVNSGATLTLDGDLVIDGGNEWIFNEDAYNTDLNDPDNKHQDSGKYVTPEADAPVAGAYMITTTGGTVNLNNVTIQNNYSAKSGIVSAGANSTVTLTGAKISHIAATQSGGVVVKADGANINVTVNEGTVIDGNHVGDNHGIFYIYNGAVLTMNGGEIKNNTGWNSNGVAVGLYYGTFIMNGGIISGNTSIRGSSNGQNAAVYLHNNAVMEMHGGEISNNSGRARGGIDCRTNNSSHTLTITGGSVVNNKSIHPDGKYPDLANTIGTCEISGGTFSQKIKQAYLAEGYELIENEDGTFSVAIDPAYGMVAKIGNEYYETLEKAIAAAAADPSITYIEVLCDYVQTSVENTEDYYDITGNLIIGAAEKVTLSGCGFAVRVKGNGATLTIHENVTIEGLDVVANGFATTGENMVINGTIKALSLKQWTSNGTITVSGTGSVWLGYGDGQFDMAYGNGTVTIEGTGDKTNAQFKAGYSGTRGNGNTLNLNNTYFEAGAWFNIGGSNGIFNVDNSLVKVSGGDAAGSMTISNSGNVINLIGDSELAVATLTLGEGNTINLGAGSKITSSKISGAGKIVIDATGMTVGVLANINADVTGFTGTLEVINNPTLTAKIVNGKIVLERCLVGAGTETDPYMINNVEELILFRDSVNAGETKYNASGKWVALGDDIDLAGTTWTEGIGDGHNWSFDGNFDGKNHTIKNLTIQPYADSSKYLCGGLFGYIYGGVTIRNLTIENATIDCGTTEGHNVGVLVGFANNNGGKANISNITLKGDIKVDAPNAYGVGGIVGYSYRAMGTISNCVVDANAGSYIKGYSFVGGITGYSHTGAIISDCSVKGINIIATSYSVGGIVGLASAGNQITGCTVDSSVNVSGQANVGSVVGALGANGVIVDDCTGAAPMVGGNYSDNKPVQAKIGNKYYADLAAALAASEAGENITLLTPYVVNAGEVVTIDLAGKTITGTDTTSANFGLIQNNGTLTINDSVGTGKIELNATVNSGWSRYSAVISNNPGGTLVVNGGTIEHLGGTDMAYGIDSLTNGNLGDVSVTINGGTIKSIYRGIRQFLNSTTAENVLTIKGGTVEGANKAIFFHDPSTKANKGTITVGEDAAINGGVYLFVTAGSTEWPVTVAIAESALNGDVVSGNVPTGYEVVNVEGIYGVYEGVAKIGNTYYSDLTKALAAAQADQIVKMLAEVEVSGYVIVDNGATLDLNGNKLTASGVITFSGSHIVDNSTDNSGILVVAKNRLIIDKDNKHLPIWNGEGYQFGGITEIKRKLNDMDADGKVKYAFKPLFDADILSLLANGTESSGVSVAVRVTWTTEQEGKKISHSQDFVFSDSHIQAFIAGYANGSYTKQFAVTMSGLEGIGEITVHTVIKTATGVEIMSNPSTHTY